IIMRLVADEPDVAEDVLEFSDVLTEDDLKAIVAGTHEVIKLRAIARRARLPETIAESLVATHEALVIEALFHNEGAPLSERVLMPSWEAIAARPSLLETLVYRGGLPPAIAEKLLHAVTGELKQELITRYRLDVPTAQKAADDTREW